MKNAFHIVALLIFLTQVAFGQQKGYYRTPALHENTVVFTAEGDLWKFDVSSGLSSRLTTHHGVESEPLLSPDGKWIVFTGEYEGIGELYSVSSEGGVPRRLTYDNWRGIKAVGWTPDGKVLYTTRSESPLDDNQLAKLDLQKLTRELVPLAQAADGAYDESGTLYFTRFSFQGSNTKRYKGGTAQNIWKFQGNAPATCLTCDFTGTSREAMVYQDRIFFNSDRDGTMNIWSMNKEGKDLKQHTHSSGWDLISPCMQGSKIVYQVGADLGMYDIATGKEVTLDIRIQSDFDQRRPRWIKDPQEKISFWEVSPGGKFVAIISRGRIFVSPANGSRWVEITRKSGIRYRVVQFLDEKNIVFLSDESGEVEVWKGRADGSEPPQQITKGATVLIDRLFVSPDGKYVAYRDRDFRLMLLKVSDGTIRLVQQNEYGNIGDYVTWSKDSQYLLYPADEPNTNTVIRAFEISTGKNQKITTDRLNNAYAQFSADQKWLYFVSSRHLKTVVDSPWGPRQPEPYFDKTDMFYALALDPVEKFPFMEPDGWVEEKKDDEKEGSENVKPDNGKKKDKPAEVVPLPIDWQRAAQKLYQIPISNRNVTWFRAAESHLYWSEIEAGQWDKQKVYALKIGYDKKMEPTLIAEDVKGFDLSSDRKKILLDKGTLYLSDANGEKIDLEKTKLNLSNWAFQFDPVDDWKQMFNDAWRMERDYFYDRNLHGLDWMAVKNRYGALVERVSDRHELDNLLAQMVSELSALHIFVYGGDKRKAPDDIRIGSLGARLSPDASGRGYIITHIYRSDPDYPDALSPLAAAHLKIQEGDKLLKINDVAIQHSPDMERALTGKVNVWVKLTLQNEKGTYDQLIKPISEDEEVSLRYGEWEYTRRLATEKATTSEVGYIHLRAMTTEDMNDFVKQFYPVFNRGGLILDVRHNGGGNIDSWVLEKLMRKAWFYWQSRTGKPYWNMQYAFRGHLVVLCDEATGSDGEAITEGVRRLGLGTIIGTRTWGGEIWLSSSNRLVDDGIATAAEDGVYADGKWLIEGHGVDPDIVVDNEPFNTFQGKDQQLEAAIAFLQEKLKKEPVTVPPPPPYPNKSFNYNKN